MFIGCGSIWMREVSVHKEEKKGKGKQRAARFCSSMKRKGDGEIAHTECPNNSDSPSQTAADSVPASSSPRAPPATARARKRAAMGRCARCRGSASASSRWPFRVGWAFACRGAWWWVRGVGGVRLRCWRFWGWGVSLGKGEGKDMWGITGDLLLLRRSGGC